MKQTKLWLTTIAALLCSLTASAHDFEVGGIYYNITSSTDLTVAVTYGGSSSNDYSNEYTGAVTIPETVTYNSKTYRVTSIGGSAFYGCSSLTSITIPEGMTEIEGSAFRDCSSLTSITIPESVTSIGNYAFYECASLKEVIIEDGSTTLSLGYNGSYEGLFYDCPLETVYLGRNLSYSSDGYSPFYKNERIPTISLGNSVTSIPPYLFYGNTNLTSFTFPESVTEIREGAFAGCSLTSITIPESVTSIGDYAFNRCTSLKEVIIEDGSTTLSLGYYGDYRGLFYDCPLETVYLGRNLSYYSGESNGYSPFYKNERIPTISLGNSVTSIPSYLFYRNTNLTSFTIPEGVTEIGNYAFNGCTSLKEVIIEDGSETLSLGYNYSDHRGTGRGLFYDCPLETVYLGRNLSYYSGESNGYSPFYKNDRIPTISLGNCVTSIPSYLFYKNTNLTSFTFSESVTEIGEGAFAGCTCELIVECDIPDYAFTGGNFKKVTIKSNVTSIGNNGFGYIKEFIIEDGNETLWWKSGSYVYSAEKVYLGRNLSYSTSESNGYSPFYDCRNLASVTIGNKVTSIGKYLFGNCEDLSSVTIGSGVTSIQSDAFPNKPNSGLMIAKVIWLTNTPPTGYANADGRINYVSNNQYTSLRNVKVYPNLSSIFEVDGVKYVPVSTSERTCDVIDCAYDSTTVINVNETASFRGIAMTVKEVMPYTFYKNKHIKKAEFLHNGNVSDYAFYDCDSLESVTLGDKITSLGAGIFAFCTSLPEITIPKSVLAIGYDAFYYCDNLADVIIADRNEPLALGSRLFDYCPLDSVYIGGKITYSTESSKGYSPFYGNTSLRTVVITDREEQIYDNEFYGCKALKNVTIGNGVKSIGDYAFSGCSSLEGFSFGSNMESIGTEAFSDCTNLTSITSHAAVPPTCGTQALDDINKWNCVLRVPSGYATAYQAADQWKDFFFVEDVVEVENSIEHSEATNQDSQSIYDLSGRKMQVNDLRELQKGVYIINGRKVVVK